MLGYLVAALGGGGVVGGLFAGRLRPANQGAVFLLGNVLEGLCWISLVLLPNPAAAVAALFVAGCLESAATAVYYAEVQARMAAVSQLRYYAMLLPVCDMFRLADAMMASLVLAAGHVSWLAAVIATAISLPVLPFARSLVATPHPAELC
jgi:hypothetical protein